MPLEKFKPLPCIAIPQTAHDTLVEIAAKSGETPENYLLGSLGLVAVWGEVVTAGEGVGTILHGIVDVLDNTCEVFDVKEILAHSDSDLKTDFSTEVPEPSQNSLQIAVPLEMKSAIDQAVGYYQTTIPKLTRVAVGIRHEILDLQDKGHVYAFSYGDDIWQSVHLARVRLNPLHN